MKSWLEKNDVAMYSTHNEGKSVVAERFTRTLKKNYMYMTSTWENAYINKSDDVVKYKLDDKYNNTYHSTIKMKPVDVKPSTYIESSKDSIYQIKNEYRNKKSFLQKAMFQISPKRFLWLKNFKSTVPWTYVLGILKEKKLLECFTKKNCKKQIKKSLELKK